MNCSANQNEAVQGEGTTFWFVSLIVVLGAVSYVVIWYLRDMKTNLWWAQDRADKSSNKLEALELRSMFQGLRCHEFVRHLSMDFENFDSASDRCWLLRRVGDLVSLFVEVRVKMAADVTLAGDALRLCRLCLRIMRDRLSKTPSSGH